MKTILVLSFSNLATDPRVNRQIRFLQNDYKVTAAGYGNPRLTGVEYIDIKVDVVDQYPEVIRRLLGLPRKTRSALRLLTGQYDNYYWSRPEILHALQKLSPIETDLIICNDIDTLPLALHLSRQKAKVIFDAHEYAPREYEDRWQFRVFFQKYITFLCERYIPKVDGMITVCKKIADTYEKETGVKPTVITNAPEYVEIEPKLLGEDEKVKLVHHGGAAGSRRLDKMIKVMDYLTDRFELNLILVGGRPQYIKYLKKLAEDKSNIYFLDPVPMRELPSYLRQFDIGIYILEPNSFNNLFALPNKLFEFIQARLAIAIGPSPEMAAIVRENDCGVVAEDFDPESLAREIMKLDREKINFYKRRSNEVAKILSAEKNQEIFLKLVTEVFRENSQGSA